MIHSLLTTLGHLLLRPKRLQFSWLSLIIWSVGIVLGFLLLFRGFRTKMVTIYPVFYTFIACVWVGDFTGYLQYLFGAGWVSYAKGFWIEEFLTMFLAGAIILEVLRHVLPADRRADKLTRFAWVGFGAVMFYFAAVYAFMAMFIACAVIVVIFWHALLAGGHTEGLAKISRIVLFGAIVFCAASYAHATTGTLRADQETYYLIERDFLAVQAILWFCVVETFFYYGLPAGRNMKGIILGCGLSAGAGLINVSVRCFAGHSVNTGCSILRSSVFLICTLIWLVTLWTRRPNVGSAQSVATARRIREFTHGDEDRASGRMPIYCAKAGRP